MGGPVPTWAQKFAMNPGDVVLVDEAGMAGTLAPDELVGIASARPAGHHPLIGEWDCHSSGRVPVNVQASVDKGDEVGHLSGLFVVRAVDDGEVFSQRLEHAEGFGEAALGEE